MTAHDVAVTWRGRDWLATVVYGVDPGQRGRISGPPERCCEELPPSIDVLSVRLQHHGEDDAKLPPLGWWASVENCIVDEAALWEHHAKREQDDRDAAAAQAEDAAEARAELACYVRGEEGLR